MWRRKGCPRCRGDLFIDEEVGKNYLKCLQCGYEKELTEKLLALILPSPGKRGAAMA
jgi:hypothetical protein